MQVWVIRQGIGRFYLIITIWFTIFFTHPGFVCWVMRCTDRISTSRQPRFSHADQWKEGWASFYGNQPACLSPEDTERIFTKWKLKHVSSAVVSSLQWWRWITRGNVASLSVESVPASHSSLKTFEASTVLVTMLEIKTPQKNIWRRFCGVDAEYTDSSNSTNVMSSESFLLPPLQVFTIKPLCI